MSTQADAVIGEPAASPPADRGPRASLRVLQGVAVLHSPAFLGQPVFAGGYLMGDVDSLTLHDMNAFVIAGLDVAQLICAVVYFWGGRGRTLPIWASLAIALAVEIQVGLGYERLLVVHLPLGVALTVGQILITIWLFGARAASARPRRSRRSLPSPADGAR